MSSKRRIKSSRANGAKSRGPVTPEGKQKASQNSVRHGILCKTVVLDDEDSDSFEGLLASYLGEFNPKTPAQLALVETMVVARWRIGRIWCIERETIQSEIEKHDPDPITLPARAALGFRDLANNSATLDLLSRYEFRFDRQYARALNLFMKLATYETSVSKNSQTDLIPEPDTPSNAPPNPVTEPRPQGSDVLSSVVTDAPSTPLAIANPHPPASDIAQPPVPSQSQEFEDSHRKPITPVPRAA